MNSSKTERDPHRYLIMWNNLKLIAINDLTALEQRRILDILRGDTTVNSNAIPGIITGVMSLAKSEQYAEIYIVDSPLMQGEIVHKFIFDRDNTIDAIKQNGELIYTYMGK